MDPNEILQQAVIDRVNSEMEDRPDTSTCHSIFPFPDVLSEVDKDIRQPKLASFGPYHKGKVHLLPFEKHKSHFYDRFLGRNRGNTHADLVQLLSPMESTITGCYHKLDTDSMSSEEFLDMMLKDGSFIVELFLRYKENPDEGWDWDNVHHIHTLIADLLKLENQLPFIVLEKLHDWSCQNGDEATSNIPLSTLALNFLNQADREKPNNLLDLSRLSFFNQARLLADKSKCLLDLFRSSPVLQPPPENNCEASDTKEPKHLLDLFRSSLLPQPPPRNNSKASSNSIRRAADLCEGGITLRRKVDASPLEIDFQELHIPPFALKIPQVDIDDPNATILMNCIALEQCMHETSKHFTAYICFMNCLLRQPEDVRPLCVANIITSNRARDDDVIKLLNSARGRIHVNARDCYLWKQYRKINSFHGSLRADIWCKSTIISFVELLVAILAAINGLPNWLFPKK